MNFLPKDIENLIIDYKEDLEKTEKLKKAVKPIKNMKKRYLYNYYTLDAQFEIFVDNKYLEITDFSRRTIRDAETYLRENLYHICKYFDNIGLHSMWACKDKNLEQTCYKDTDYYDSFPEEF